MIFRKVRRSESMRYGLVLAVVVTTAVSAVAANAFAAPTAEQRAEIDAIGALLTKAGNLYKEQKFKESGEVVKDVQTRLAKLAESADAQIVAQLSPIHRRLVNAHALLELEGIALPELKPLERPAAKAKAKTKSKSGAGTISFVKEVAPILNARCGRCHVRNARGQFSMATYESLMKGPPQSGKVIFPGDASGSVLIEKVQDKEMPPDGSGMAEDELAKLKKWVEEGAHFDGPDAAAQLTSYISPGNEPAAAPMATVQQATGTETISFARDVAPLFVKNCTRCHGPQNPPNNFSLNTMANLLRGGDRGQPILPGKPADSLLIKKLKGTADGARMPQRAAPLDDATVATIEKWIAEGAKFDGPNANQPIAEVAAIAKAQSSTHEQLSAERAELAQANWRLGMPSTPANKHESKNFLVLGSVGENTLADIGQRAEALAPKVADIFKAPRDQPLVKGRVTLFVFGERYDYGEFGKMVEKRDIPSSWRGHFGYSIVDAYGAVQTPKGNEHSLDALIAQQLGAVYVASLGKGVPRWFAEGCGRVVATRMAPASDSRVGRWDEELSGAIGSLASPDDFLTGKLSPEQADVCAFSFVKYLMADRRFPNLIDALRSGGEFPKTFSATFGGTPQQLAATWARNPPKVGRRTGK
jgi:mono/diheme cytochrome c family protein